MLDDDARYQCQVGPGPQGMRYIFAHIFGCDNLIRKQKKKNFQVNPEFDLDLQQ